MTENENVTCRGTKKDGTPCGIRIGLNQDGLCPHCAKRAGENTFKPGLTEEESVKNVADDPAPEEQEPVEEKTEAVRNEPGGEEMLYSFPSRVRCPYCGDPNSRRVGQDRSRRIQYRECYRKSVPPLCPGNPQTRSHRFPVFGTKLPSKEG